MVACGMLLGSTRIWGLSGYHWEFLSEKEYTSNCRGSIFLWFKVYNSKETLGPKRAPFAVTRLTEATMLTVPWQFEHPSACVCVCSVNWFADSQVGNRELFLLVAWRCCCFFASMVEDSVEVSMLTATNNSSGSTNREDA